MFLTIEDYKPVCSPRELDVLQQSDNDTRQRAERVALEEVASYLRTRYDMQKTYAATGDDRNAHLVQICVNVTLFYLVQWLPGKMASGNRTSLYEYAIEWLKSVQKGAATADLPEYTNEAGDAENPVGYPMAAGGMDRQTYDW